MGRLDGKIALISGVPAETAQAAVFLASDESSFVTGIDLWRCPNSRLCRVVLRDSDGAAAVREILRLASQKHP